jgi:sigma-B regulation protein RsbU (phosphoserine phosphatase)
MFATVFVGQYDPISQQIHYANAGHSPVIYAPQGQAPYLLEAESTPLGVLPECVCENQSIPFHMGDVLVIGSDGFVEARNTQSEMFGYPRLLQVIADCRAQSAAEIAASLFAQATAFSGDQPQEDDQTILVLKRVSA